MAFAGPGVSSGTCYPSVRSRDLVRPPGLPPPPPPPSSTPTLHRHHHHHHPRGGCWLTTESPPGGLVPLLWWLMHLPERWHLLWLHLKESIFVSVMNEWPAVQSKVLTMNQERRDVEKDCAIWYSFTPILTYRFTIIFISSIGVNWGRIEGDWEHFVLKKEKGKVEWNVHTYHGKWYLFTTTKCTS